MALTPFLTGANLSAITIAPISVDSSGNVTVGSSTSIRAYIQSVEGTLSEELEDIRPVWSLQRNMVRTGYGNTLRISALQRSDAANYLVTLVTGYSYCQVAWTQGASTFTGQYKIANLGYGVGSRGQNVNTLDLEPINNGEAANIAVT